MTRGEQYAYEGDGEPEGEAGDDTANRAGNGDGPGVHATASDALLTDLLRQDTPAGRHALDELRARHGTTVLTYARLYTVDEPAALQLTDEALASAAQETERGRDPKGPWRHHLLLLTVRVAASWATDGRAVRLAPGLLSRLGEPGPTTAPMLLAAFHALPTRVQGLLWYGVVDEEPDERTAMFLGCAREDVAYGAEPAFQALRHSVLTDLLARSADPDCQDFRRLIEEAAHPETPGPSPDLQAHMTYCGHCAGAYRELAALRYTPRTALAEGLLAWGGRAYVMGGSTGAPAAGTGMGARTGAGRGSGAGAGAGGSAVGGGRWPGWLPSRRVTVASAALGVAVAPLLVYLLTSAGSEQQQASAAQPSTRPPAAAVTPAPEPTPTPTSKSPSMSGISRPPKSAGPTPTPTPTTSKPKPKPEPTPTKDEPGPPDATYAQVVNASTGLCLDIRGGELEKGTDVVTAPCSSSRTQIWRVDTGRDVVQSFADPDYCLDSRGSTSRGVGIWECASVDGPDGRNLRFTVDSDGTIAPAIALGHAVTPLGAGTLFLLPDQGREEQRWRAGAEAE